MAGKGQPKTGGRTKGTPNKTTALLKDAAIEAAERAGDKDGMVGYLTKQAHENPVAFLTLLGKVLPIQQAQPYSNEPTTIVEISFADHDDVAAQELKARPVKEIEALPALAATER
jgi:hypothetical protein